MPRKILVSDTSGSFQVVIPDNAKITFGPAIPFPARQEQRMNFQPGDRSYSLRIYVGSKENLYAVFPDVRGFRDLSLEVEAVEDPLEDADIEMSEREQPAPAPRRRASTRPSRRVLETSSPTVPTYDRDPPASEPTTNSFAPTGTTTTTSGSGDAAAGSLSSLFFEESPF